MIVLPLRWGNQAEVGWQFFSDFVRRQARCHAIGIERAEAAGCDGFELVDDIEQREGPDWHREYVRVSVTIYAHVRLP